MPKEPKTKPMPDKQKCVLKVLSRDSDLNFNVRIEIIRSGWNRNRWNYQNIEQHYKTFLGTPILCAFPHGQIGDGHNMDEGILPNGEPFYDFTGPNSERIVGCISDKPEDIWTEERSGETWICANGTIWRFYNRQLADHLAEQGGMEVSAETEVYEEYEEKGKGSVFTSWRGLGVTILNEKVMPAVPGANIKALKALGEEEWKTMKLAAASYNSSSGSGTPNETEDGSGTPDISKKGVKETLNLSKKQLAELNKKFEGYTVLAAVRNDDESIDVRLRNEKYEICSYLMANAEETIVPEKFSMLSAKMSMNGIEIDAEEMYDSLSAEIVTLNSKREKLESDLEEAQKTITAMRDAESKRRVNAAKDAANAALSEFNANRAEKVDASEIEKVISDIDAGVYANCAAADGEWNGCDAVRTAVLAICAMRDIAVQKKNAEMRRETYLFGNEAHEIPDDDGSISALLRQIKISE